MLLRCSSSPRIQPQASGSNQPITTSIKPILKKQQSPEKQEEIIKQELIEKIEQEGAIDYNLLTVRVDELNTRSDVCLIENM